MHILKDKFCAISDNFQNPIYVTLEKTGNIFLNEKYYNDKNRIL